MNTDTSARWTYNICIRESGSDQSPNVAVDEAPSVVILIKHDADRFPLEHKLQARLVQRATQSDWGVHQVSVVVATTKEPIVEVPVLGNPVRCPNRIVIRGLKETEMMTSIEYVWMRLLVGQIGSRSFAIQSCNLYVQVLELVVTELCEKFAGSIFDWLCGICFVQSG